MTKTWKQGTSLIRRIANRLRGAGEKVARTLTQTVLISKIMYGLRFYKIDKKNMEKLESLLNDARRCIAGLPRNVKIEELHKCVPFPSFEELRAIQEEMHKIKMLNTKEGRRIMNLLNQDTSKLDEFPEQMPPWERIMVVPGTPIPKSMGLDHQERRRRYAKKHNEEIELIRNDPELAIYYTDAAVSNNNATIAFHLLNIGTWAYPTVADTPEEAEAQAVLAAVEHASSSTIEKKRITIFTDSQEVIRACKIHHAVSPTIRKILKAAITTLKKKNATILLRWIPGHTGIKGNEIANKVAKEYSRSLLSDRPGQSQRDHPYSTVLKSLSKEYDPIATINKAKKQLQQQLRNRHPEEQDPIPSGLKRYQTVLLRRVRTGSAITPHLLKKWETQEKLRQDPKFIPKPPECNFCREKIPPNIDHLLWDCKHFRREREDAHATIDPEDKPENLNEWIKPAGNSGRRLQLLKSVISYLEKTGLSKTF
ncbi:uncharacterized protein LOC115320851 [Ixodes scapularis]|uniref:uncharacterized protein LOC115320851 n=1 Tax=Ixodes scapularis TaxID=6945 RepID=UPI001A9E2832|nr:uncharacterized protein LOC115320851 [Ixodes scapularis]